MIQSTFLVLHCQLGNEIPYTDWLQASTGAQKHLIPTKLDRIAHAAGGELRGAASSTAMDRVCTDSRGASPGDLFVALQGQQADGHRFLADAFRNGATAAMVSKDRLNSIAVEPGWPLIVVSDPLRGLQALARAHRHEYFERVLAITGMPVAMASGITRPKPSNTLGNTNTWQACISRTTAA